MNYFDILLAKKMGGSTPLPENAYLLTTIADGDLTSAKQKPLPSVSVAVTDADELDVFVGDSETITSDNEPYIYRQSKGGRMVSERLVGASAAWNQLVGSSDTSVTVTSGHKYALYKNSTWSVGISDGTAIAVTGGTDMCFDLTLMFGSTIADYVYSLEQSTAGSGIAWLKSYGFFSEDYYAYDSGSLKSVSVSEKKVRDASDNVIATYPLPSSDLRGLYKLSSNKLYCDGDVQYGDGWRLRRYGIVDLGTLDWEYMGSALAFSASVTDIKPTVNVSTKANAICSKYQVITRNERENGGLVVIWVQSEAAGKIYVYDSAYSDVATFKTAMSGVMLVYELATPTWEKTHPFTNPQTVGSTEEFVANLPVGHESKYYDGDIHHSYIYAGDTRAKVTGDVDIVNGTAPNATCSVCVVMPDGDEIWSDAGDVTAEIWT